MIINNLYDVDREISEARSRLSDKINGVIRGTMDKDGGIIDVELKIGVPVWDAKEFCFQSFKSNTCNEKLYLVAGGFVRV